MPPGYCEAADVRKALQEVNLSGPIDTSLVEPAITGVSTWLRKRSGRHWYDSNAGANALVATGPRSVSNTRLDIPTSPHSQRDQLFRADHNGVEVRYPVTTHGPYARLPLPHAYVETLTSLEVRDRAGGVTDWVASSDFQAGRGEDYYLLEEDQEGHGHSALYVRAASIGARSDYEGLLTVDYDYGLDEQTESWEDVRRGVANLAAAQVVTDDDVLTSIPDNGQLVGVDTQYDQHVDAALGSAFAHLSPYLEVPTA